MAGVGLEAGLADRLADAEDQLPHAVVPGEQLLPDTVAGVEQVNQLRGGLALGGDLLLHEELERRTQRHVADTQLGPLGEPPLGQTRICQRVHRPVRIVEVDELPFGQRDEDARQAQHRRQVAGGENEVAVVVGPLAHIQRAAALDGVGLFQHRVHDHRGVRAADLPAPLADGLDHAGAPHRPLLAPVGGVLLQVEEEEMLHGVDQHFAVVVAEDDVPLQSQVVLERLAVGEVAVVRPVDAGLAGDQVRLGVEVVHRAEGGPADLAAEQAARQGFQLQRLDHVGRGAHRFLKDDSLAFVLNAQPRRVVPAVLQLLQEPRGDLAQADGASGADHAQHSAADGGHGHRQGELPAGNPAADRAGQSRQAARSGMRPVQTDDDGHARISRGGLGDRSLRPEC